MGWYSKLNEIGIKVAERSAAVGGGSAVSFVQYPSAIWEDNSGVCFSFTEATGINPALSAGAPRPFNNAVNCSKFGLYERKEMWNDVDSTPRLIKSGNRFACSPSVGVSETTDDSSEIFPTKQLISTISSNGETV